MKLILFVEIILTLAYFANCQKIGGNFGVGTMHINKGLSFTYFDLQDNVNCLSFSIRSEKGMDITLSKKRMFNDFSVEFYLGLYGKQSTSCMKRTHLTENLIETEDVNTPNIIISNHYHSFWLSWNHNDGKFQLGVKGENTPILEYVEDGVYEIHYFGVRSPYSSGDFYFEEPNCPNSPKSTEYRLNEVADV